MISRRAIREHVFVLLFQSMFNDQDEMPEIVKNYFEVLEKPLDDESTEYIRSRFLKVLELKDELDGRIEENSTGWKLGRIGKVELAILRLAVFEICYDDDIPDKVAINEAVELAKKYGQEQAGSFVNGVLAKFA